MDLSKLKWTKNIRHQGDDKKWAYEVLYMEIPEARVFGLNWRDPDKHKNNAEQPEKGELILLLQHAKATHVVELIDDEVYTKDNKEWGIYRVVKVLWMPPENFNWDNLPHQRELFGFEYNVQDGLAHDLDDDSKMRQFHNHWHEKGGLKAFQNHVKGILIEIS